MSQYSQMVGSFERTGNFPFEKEYEFASYEELYLWSIDPINHATLYPGLKKLVKPTEGKLLEYWVVEKDEDLVFEPYTSESESSSILIERTNIEETEYKKDDQVLIITLKLGDYEWNETIPLNNIIESIKDDFSSEISSDSYVLDLKSRLDVLLGLVDALIATGGGSGSSISKIEIISFTFVDGKTTYVVDPNKLTDDEKENGVDVPIKWEYNINFNNNDKLYIYLDGKQTYTLGGTDTTFTIPGVKKTTTVKLEGLSKTYGLQATSDVIKITFGITIYVGGSAEIDSLSASIITPQIDSDGDTYIDIPFEELTTDDFRYFAIPEDVFEVEDPKELVLRDENNFVILGYTTSIETDSEGNTYYVYKLDNIIHGSFTIKISN